MVEDHLLKDKAFRRYAAGVDKALSLFETALEEWADYISFLNRLLKVGYATNNARRFNLTDACPLVPPSPATLRYHGPH